MQKVQSIQSVKHLTPEQVYQYEGVLYRFIERTGRDEHPQFIFRPLNGQRKKADLKLNQKKVLWGLASVPGMTTNAEMINNYVQMTMF